MFTETTAPVPPDPADTAWTPDEVARELKISTRHLTDVRKEDDSFPKPRMLGDCPRWSPIAIRSWLAWTPQPPAADVTSAPKSKGRIK